MIAEKKYNNGDEKRKERQGQGNGEKRTKGKVVRQGYCVKCGKRFKVTTSIAPASPDARPRWSKFEELGTCPHCGDDKGHAGIFREGDIELTDEDRWLSATKRRETSTIELRYADLTVKEYMGAVGEQRRSETIQALMEHRQISQGFAEWLVDKSVWVGTIAELRTKVSASAFSELRVPRQFDLNANAFFLPIRYYLSPRESYFVGLQIRQTAKDAEIRYITVRLSGQTPLVHFALPTTNGKMTERVAEVWLTEGFFKAEAIAHYRQAVAIGALGAIAQRDAIEALMDAAIWWQKDADLFAATVILAPDADYREKQEVAKAAWRAKRALERQGFEVRFAIWDKRFKGIDDALEGQAEIFVVDEDVWLATLPRKIRDTILGAEVRTRVRIDYELAQAIELPECETVVRAVEAGRYEAEKRKQYWLETIEALADKKKGRCPSVIIDISPAGTGKTKTAATLRIKELRGAGINAKRVVYIAPEIKRAPVQELERFRHFVGRDEECVYYDRLKELEQEGLTLIGRRVCAYCPVKKRCGYYAQKQTSRRYWRISWQSYSPREGDFVIIDEFSRLGFFKTYEVTKREFDELIRAVDKDGANQELIEVLKQLRRWLSEGDRTDEEVKSLLRKATEKAYDWLVDELNIQRGDIREAREWVFGERKERPKTFFWAELIADIRKGLKVGQVWIEKGTLKIMVVDEKLRKLKEKVAGILILDSTVRPEEVLKLLEMSVEPVRSDEPNIYPKVIQVLLVAMTHRASKARKEEILRLAKEVLRGLMEKGILPQKIKLGILTHKNAAEIARKVFGKKATIGWWGRDERATNVFYEQGCNVLLCVGLPYRNISAIAAEKGKAGYKLKALRKAKLDREGKHWTVIKEFADQKLALAVRKKCGQHISKQQVG